MEHSPESKNPSEHASPTEWEQVAKMAKHINQRQAEKAPEYATELYKSALDVEKDFDRRRQTIESEGGEMSQKEFEKWEEYVTLYSSYVNTITDEIKQYKQISFEESVDPFYSKENMERLRKSIAQMEATGGTIHEVNKV